MVFINTQISLVQAAYNTFSLRKANRANEVNKMGINILHNQQGNKKHLKS